MSVSYMYVVLFSSTPIAVTNKTDYNDIIHLLFKMVSNTHDHNRTVICNKMY